MVLDDVYAKERVLFHLDWLLNMERRHDHVLQSGLVHIALNPDDVQRVSFGASDAAEKLGEVLSCLQSACRSTDLMMREGMSFWIITSFTHLDLLTDKVKTIMATAPHNGLEIAENQIHVYMLRDFMQPGMPSFERSTDFLDLLAHSASDSPSYASSTAYH